MGEHRRLDLVGASEAPDAAPPAGDEATQWLAFEMDLADDEPGETGALFYNTAGVRLEVGRIVEHDAGDVVYRCGDKVTCETPTGVSQGVVVIASRRTFIVGKPPWVLGLASRVDTTALAELRAREQKVYFAARAAVKELQLPVKVVRAEAAGGGDKFIVYFASEERAPFRDILTSVSQATRERVELRQIGLRDAAKEVGGVGPCGLQLCCNTFLSEFAPVTIKMAKDQGLGVNPQKLSGVCGRLLCCLVYEEAFYRAQRQLVPRMGDRVGTDRGEGRVQSVDVLQMLVKVTLDSGETVTRPALELTRTVS